MRNLPSAPGSAAAAGVGTAKAVMRIRTINCFIGHNKSPEIPPITIKKFIFSQSVETQKYLRRASAGEARSEYAHPGRSNLCRRPKYTPEPTHPFEPAAPRAGRTPGDLRLA